MLCYEINKQSNSNYNNPEKVEMQIEKRAIYD